MTKVIEHWHFENIRTAAEKIRLLRVRRINRTTKNRNTKCVQVVFNAVGWPLAFELDGDSRCGGDAWISDH